MKVLIFELILIVILIPLNIVLKKHVPKWKRKAGEKFVKRILGKLDSKSYYVLHDVTVYTEYGDTTQIDHIVIAETGVFVIETKNYEGWIDEVRNQQGGHRVFLERNPLFKTHFDKTINI